MAPERCTVVVLWQSMSKVESPDRSCSKLSSPRRREPGVELLTRPCYAIRTIYIFSGTTAVQQLPRFYFVPYAIERASSFSRCSLDCFFHVTPPSLMPTVQVSSWTPSKRLCFIEPICFSSTAFGHPFSQLATFEHPSFSCAVREECDTCEVQHNAGHLWFRIAQQQQPIFSTTRFPH